MNAGVNREGNYYETAGGTNYKNGQSYHYSNNDGSYYYKNDNGTTFYKDSYGNSTYTVPVKPTYYRRRS